MFSSVLVLRPFDKRLPTSEYTKWAELAGLKMIRLVHKFPPIRVDGVVSIGGFQCAYINRIERQSGGIFYKYELSKSINGNGDLVDCSGPYALKFEKDNVDGRMYDCIPDTAFNRQKLVATFFDGASWNICDPEIEKEVRDAYDKIKKTVVEEKEKDEVITEIDERAKLVEEENQRLKAEIAKLTASRPIVEAAKNRTWSRRKGSKSTHKQHVVKAQEQPKEVLNVVSANSDIGNTTGLLS